MVTSQSPPPNDQPHEGDVVPHVSKDPLTAEELGRKLALLLGLPPVIEIATEGVMMDTSQSPPPNDEAHAVDFIPLVPKDSSAGEEARCGECVRNPNAQRDSSDQRVPISPEGSESTAQYRQSSRSSLGLPVAPFVVGPKELAAAKEVQSGTRARDLNATRNLSQSLGMAPQRSERSPGLRAMKASIRMSPRPSGLNDRSDSPSIGRRRYRGVARIFVVALIAAFIGVAASFWQSHGDKAVKLVRTYAPSLGSFSSEWQSRGATTWAALLDWLFPAPTKSPIDIDVAAKQPGSNPAGQVSAQNAAPQQSTPLAPKQTPAAASTSPELVQQLEAMARDLAVVRHEVEQLAATQEQMTHNIASPQAVQQDTRQKEPSSPLSSSVHLPRATQQQMTHDIASAKAVQQDIGQKKSPQPLSSAVHLPPPKNTPGAALRQPPARVAILADWWIPDGPSDGWVYVQGHGDVYRVVLGTPLPGLGPVEQIKRQDGHWVVVTPKGIIVPRRDPLPGGERDVLDRDRINPDDDAD